MGRLTVRPGGYEVDTGRSHPLVPVTATLAALAMGAVGIYGGGIGVAVLGKSGARGPADGFTYSAPNTPSFVAVVPTDTSVLVSASAFNGSGDDTHDSTTWQLDTLGGDFSAPIVSIVTADSLTAYRGAGLGASIPLTTDSLYQLRVRYHGALSGLWSSYSVVDTFTATAVAFLALKPATWTDTVHIETFSDTLPWQTPQDTEGYINGTSGGPGNGGADAGLYATDLNEVAHGGRLTGFSVDSMLVDSIANSTGMWSPPWSAEIVYNPGLGGQSPFNIRLDMDEGNGSDAAGNLTRAWIAWLECWEFSSGGCGPGVADFPMNDQGTKGLFINVGGGQHIFDWFGTWVITGNITDPVTGCPHLVANNMGADTLDYPHFGSRPECVNVGDTGNQFGQWVERWICWDTSGGGSNGVVAFGAGSEIWGYHTGVSTSQMGAMSNIRWTSTWGGGGNKSGTHSRWYDHAEIYTGSSGSCPSPS